MTPSKTVTRDDVPELTEDERETLARLAALPDEEIDTSDAPEMTDARWAHAVRGRWTPKAE